MAIAVASLFVAPVMANSDDYKIDINGLQGKKGYIVADDALFQEALTKSGYKDTVFLSMYGKTDDKNKYGLADVTLTKKEGYKLTRIDFADNTGLVTLDRKAKLTLRDTKVELTKGLVFRAAAKSYNKGQTPTGQLTSKNDVYLENSTLKGDVINRYWSYSEGSTYFDITLKQETNIHVSKGSQWIGDFADNLNLGTSMGKPVNKEDVQGTYTIKLEGNSTWTGGVNVVDKSSTGVTLTDSNWNVNKDSKVNSIVSNGTNKGGVSVLDDVNLTIANGNKTDSSINNLTTGANSKLTVENANVKVENLAGKGMIELNKDGKVTVNATADKVNAHFNTLEGSQLTTLPNVNADVTIAGDLVDKNGIDGVIKDFNDNKSYIGQGNVTISGGLIADEVYGTSVDGKFVQTGTKQNAQVASIGEGTAITMMQWRADADDLSQRMGDLRNSNGTVGAWARTFGGKAEAGYVENEYYGLQGGIDTQLSTDGTKQFVGAALSYTTGDAKYKNGTGDNYMGTFTGYSTWLFENGAYIDLAGKFGKLNNEFDLAVEGKTLSGKYSTQALAVTVESGHRFPIANFAYFEPQVAFTASHIFGEEYGASHGVTVKQDSINSYVARVGVQAGLNCPDNMGSIYARASYLYDFDGETTTTASMANAKNGNRYVQDFGGGWYELVLGMNVNFTKNFYGYADFEYASGNDIKLPYRWNAGVRYVF